MIWSKFHTWFSSRSFNPFLVGLGNSLNSCSIAFPVSHISTLGTSVCCCELVSLLRDNTLLSPSFNLDRLWTASRSTCVASSPTSSGASSVTSSSSEAGTVIMGGSVSLQGEDTQFLISWVSSSRPWNTPSASSATTYPAGSSSSEAGAVMI